MQFATRNQGFIPVHGPDFASEDITKVASGLASLLRVGLAPLGEGMATFHKSLMSVSRMDHGLVVILPGIEGCSTINDGIARGLVAANIRHAVCIRDWRRYRPWSPLHMVSLKHNRQQAALLAEQILTYQQEFPGRPIHLIGHSAGAGMALFILEALPEQVQIDSVILLAAAVSRSFPVDSVLSKTRDGIWNFYSPLDFPTVGIGTAVFGTMDRRHSVSAGALGFDVKHARDCSGPLLRQVRYRWRMAESWNFGGHFGWTNAAFVRRHLAPIVR